MHRFLILATTIFFVGASINPGIAQSDTEQRDTDVVQSVYLRTLSVDPSANLVKNAQMAFDLAVRSYGATDSRTADMAVNLGRALNGTGQNAASIPLLESALSIYADGGDDSDLRSAIAHYELGIAHAGSNNAAAATASLTQAYAGLAPTFQRLSADTSYIRDALLKVGGQEAVQAAKAKAASTAPITRAQPKPKLQIPPIYPPDESASGVDGWVLLDYRLWPDGSVRDVYVLAASPQNVFDISAAMALMQWQFEAPSNPSAHNQLNVAFNAR